MKPLHISEVMIICFLLLFTATTLATESSKGTLKRQPNIIYILSDDLGHADVGFTNGFVETPVLNRLARQGKLQCFYL